MLLWKAHEYTANLIRYWIKYQLFWLENSVVFFFSLLFYCFCPYFVMVFPSAAIKVLHFLLDFTPSFHLEAVLYIYSARHAIDCDPVYYHIVICFKCQHVIKFVLGRSLIPFYLALSLPLYFVRAYAVPIFTIYICFLRKLIWCGGTLRYTYRPCNIEFFLKTWSRLE